MATQKIKSPTYHRAALLLRACARTLARALIDTVIWLSWKTPIPGNAVRRCAARIAGVDVNKADLGKRVRFINTNVTFHRNVSVGNDVTFDGIARITVCSDVDLPNGATFTTASRAGDPVIHAPLTIDESLLDRLKLEGHSI